MTVTPLVRLLIVGLAISAVGCCASRRCRRCCAPSCCQPACCCDAHPMGDPVAPPSSSAPIVTPPVAPDDPPPVFEEMPSDEADTYDTEAGFESWPPPRPIE